jgi:hypothetical protein
MRARDFAVVLFAMIALPGCGGKPSAPSDAATQPKSSSSVEGLLGKDSQPPPPPPAPDPSTPSPAPSPPSAVPSGEIFSPRVEESMGQLTMFVQQFNMEFKRMPTNLNELVTTAHYLPYVFTPPKGKKWIIDAKAKQVKLANQLTP